jgi:predicted TIM-barrel fold metal-dependent hydrolase
MSSTTRYELISADSHVLEPADLFETRLPSGLRGRAPKLVSSDGVSVWEVDGVGAVPLPASAVTGSGYDLHDGVSAGAAFDDVMPALYDPAERVKAQYTDSVDAEVLYGYPYLWDAIKQSDDAELRLGCAQAYNDWIAEFCSHAPEKLIGVGRIPTSGIEAARDEMQRCVDDLALKGFVLDAWPDDATGPTDPALDQLWEVANASAVPVSFHFGVGNSRSAPPANIAAGLKPPAADAMLPLASANVFGRFPDLRMVMAHADAGWTLHWMEFLDNTYMRQRHLDLFKLPDPDVYPSEYMRRNFWFTVHQDRTAVTNRWMLGTGHLMWASHFPLDSTNWPDNRQQAMKVTEEVPTEDRQAILADNVARLYQLPGYEPLGSAPYDSIERLVHI